MSELYVVPLSENVLHPGQNLYTDLCCRNAERAPGMPGPVERFPPGVVGGATGEES